MKYVNWDKYHFYQRIVPLGYEQWPLLKGELQKRLRQRLTRRGMQWYDLNDLQVELLIMLQCLRARFDIIHLT